MIFCVCDFSQLCHFERETHFPSRALPSLDLPFCRFFFLNFSRYFFNGYCIVFSCKFCNISRKQIINIFSCLRIHIKNIPKAFYHLFVFCFCVVSRSYIVYAVKLYINDEGLAKLRIALARGKKEFDKRQTIKEKDIRREMERGE